MKPIRIDFAPASAARTLRRTSPRTWFFAVAGLLLSGYGAYTAMQLHEQHASAQRQMQTLAAKQEQRTAQRPALKKAAIPDSQAAAVNSAVAQLNLPWRDVLTALEEATPPTIALLAVEPDAKKSLVKGLAEAKSSDGMIGYIEQLKQQEFFHAVILTKHETNDQDPNRPLRFQFEAHWTEEAQ